MLHWAVADSLGAIARDLRRCRCPLARTARHPVPGEGPRNARVSFVGQAPGRTEDKIGRPVVGRAGRYFDRMLASIGLDRRRVFITSVEKHYPPGNRPPRREEIEACLPFLVRQLAVVQPRVVVVLGRIAERSLQGVPLPAGCRVVVTVHPAAAMRFPRQHRRFVRDLRALIRTGTARETAGSRTAPRRRKRRSAARR